MAEGTSNYECDGDGVGEQIKEVYARFGLAVFQAQCVERQLAIVLASAYGPGVHRITRAQFDDLLGAYFKRTLGALVTVLRQTYSPPVDLEAQLAEALTIRNWLIHNYFWERAAAFAKPAGREKMLIELDEATIFLAAVDERLTAISRQWGHKNGVTEADYETALKELLDQEAEYS